MKKAMLKLLLLAVSVFIALFIAEIGLRLFKPQIVECKINYQWRADDAVLPYVLKPSYKGRMFLKDQFDVGFITNSQGFRNLKDFSIDKPDNVKRILFLGDSFVFGTGVDDKSTFVYILNNELSKAGTKDKFEVINAGVYGFDIVQYEEWFKRNLKYDPDIIFLGLTLENDFNIVPLKNDTSSEGIRIENEKNLKYGIKNFINNLHFVVLIRDRLYVNFPKIRNIMFSLGINHKRDIFLKEYTNTLKNSLLKTEKILKGMKDVCQERKIRFVVMLIPLKEQIYCRKEINKFSGYDIDRPNKAIKEILARNGIEFIDFLPVLVSQSNKTNNRFYYDTDPHWTRYGHDVAARTIYDYLSHDRQGVL